MPVFRIHRMKETPRENFRWAPHVSGMANVKPKDYESAAEVDAESEYAAWRLLRASGQALNVGDLLEAPTGELRICKYVGFEEARWILPDVRLPEMRLPEVGVPDGPSPAEQQGFVPPPAAADAAAQIHAREI